MNLGKLEKGKFINVKMKQLVKLKEYKFNHEQFIEAK